ncbi:MAG: heavy-metal-associated domain-containing protein [Phycisphaeraceae bacterium]|nr:heavy-metal-associated domain-containing protein [Phycisphaeraceae bacterium]
MTTNRFGSTLMVMFCACALVTLLSACAGGGSGASRDDGAGTGSARTSWMSDTAPIDEASATLTVQGLSCPKCANNVDLSLAKVRGVKSAAIDMASGEVKVAFAEEGARPSRADLARAIDRTGFTLVDIRVP